VWTIDIRSRAVPLIAALVVLVLGLAVHITGPPGSDKLGDALYAGLVVLLTLVLRPAAPARVLALLGVVWCWGVELLQLTSVPDAAAARFPPAGLVLGSGFDPVDLLAYVVGVLLTVTAVVTFRS
jgi:hypothetical protein